MSLVNLQKKIGVSADGAFGPGTFKRAAAFYKLSSNRAAHFFAQTAHESGGFKAFSENLNYSAKGLRGIFGKYFPTDLSAQMYARQPERIANRVYANRMGNGPESSGDGWKYRGRGALQLTGKFSYQAFADYIGRPVAAQIGEQVRQTLVDLRQGCERIRDSCAHKAHQRWHSRLG